MQDAFYLKLSDDVIALCEELVARAAAWHLPIKRKESFVGFGRQHGFYMFWIARKDGVDYFKARAKYSRKHLQGIVYYPLAAENRNAILEAAEVIYREYLAHGSELEFSCMARSKPLVLQKEIECGDLEPVRKKKSAFRKSSWHRAASQAVSVWKEWEDKEEADDLDAELLQSAQAFSCTLDRLLSFLSNAIRTAHTKDFWQRYVLTDIETLEQIGTDYGVTRECIRQRVKKANQRISTTFLYYCTHEGYEEFDAYISTMLQVLEKASRVLPLFLQNAFLEWGERKKKMVLQLLFGENNGEELFDACAKCQNARVASAQKQDDSVKRFARLQEMIRYPTEVYADTEEPVSVFPKEKEYESVANFRKQLEKLQAHLRFVQNPNIVYFSFFQTDYRPDFLLELENGRRVLVLVLPVLNMAVFYNVSRAEALRNFCERKGYGYLIVDDRGQTSCEIECFPVDPDLKEALDAVLLSKHRILWADILEVKKTHKVSNAQLAAYIMQSKLHFVLKPYFCIYRSRKEA